MKRAAFTLVLPTGKQLTGKWRPSRRFAVVTRGNAWASAWQTNGFADTIADAERRAALCRRWGWAHVTIVPLRLVDPMPTGGPADETDAEVRAFFRVLGAALDREAP